MAVTGRIPTLFDLQRSRELADRFIGRSEELAALRSAWPPVTVVFGEPGGGKTRLLAEAALVARVSAVNIACHPSVQSVPLEPLLAVMHELRGGPPRAVESERPSEGARLIAIREVLERESAGGLLIQIDDAQWADEQTLDAISYLADRLRDSQIRWHIAARVGDDRCERLAVRLAQMRVGNSVRLREFGIADFRAFVAMTSDKPVDDAAIAELYALSGGNPLYTEQLIFAAAAGEAAEPAGLNALLAERIQALGDIQLQAARAMAVHGEAVPFGVLSELCGIQPEALASVIVDLEARFVAKISTRGIQFRHDLLRRACYSWTPAIERTRLHAVMARLAEDPWRRIRHLDGAGMRAEAASTLLRHGLAMFDRADRVEAKAALEGSAERAFDLPDVRTQAHAGLAALLALSGETDMAVERMREVENSSQDLPAAVRVDMRCRFAEAVFEGSNDTATPSEFLRLAIADARIAAQPSLTRLYAVAGALADRSGDSREAERLLRMGSDACTAATPVRDRIRLKSWIGVVRGRLGDPERGMRDAEEAAEMAIAHGLGAEFGQACLKCCYLCDLLGDRQAYESWCRRGIEHPGVKVPRVSAMLRLNLATAIQDNGALEEALAVDIRASEEARFGSATLRVQVGCSLALAYAMLGRLSEAALVVTELERAPLTSRWERAVAFVAGRVAEMGGDLERALAAYRAVAAGWIGRCDPEGTDVRAKAGEARMCYLLGLRDDLEAVRAWALEAIERGWPLVASLRAEIEGYALIAAGEIESGTASLLDAAASSKERFRAAHLRAIAGLAVADRDLINEAIGEFDEMGAVAASEDVRRKAHGIGLRPRHRPRSKHGVTTSERRIADLIRGGKTNAEIGTALGLSTKTVEHYVSNMLSKFSLRSRAQLAATIGVDDSSTDAVERPPDVAGARR